MDAEGIKPGRPYQSSRWSARSHADWFGCADAGYAAVCGTVPTPVRGHRGRTLGKAAQHQGGRPLAGFLESGRREQDRVAMASSAAVGRKIALIAEEPPRRAPAGRAVQATRVEVPLQPHEGEAIVYTKRG
jgi:hypothetical protein